MSLSNIVLIAAMECEQAARALGDDASLEDRARAAMRAAKGHWLAPADGDAFSAACEGLYRTANEEERERIEDDLGRAQKLNAMLAALQAGIPVDFEAMETPESREDPLSLNKIWRDLDASAETQP